MGGLAAALTHLAGAAQQPVERRFRAQVDAFIEQGGPHLGWGEVGEPVAVQHLEDRLLLGSAQRPRLMTLPMRDARWALAVAVPGFAGGAGSSRPATPRSPRRRLVGPAAVSAR